MTCVNLLFLMGFNSFLFRFILVAFSYNNCMPCLRLCYVVLCEYLPCSVYIKSVNASRTHTKEVKPHQLIRLFYFCQNCHVTGKLQSIIYEKKRTFCILPTFVIPLYCSHTLDGTVMIFPGQEVAIQ